MFRAVEFHARRPSGHLVSRRAAVSIMLALLGFSMALGLLPPAHAAVSYTVSDMASCDALPASSVPSYSSPDDCQISGTLTLNPGDTLTVDSPITLAIVGMLDSSGTVTLNGGVIQEDGAGSTITNAGVIDVVGNAGLLDTNGFTLTNSGTIYVGPEGALFNSGTVSNSGTIGNDGLIEDAAVSGNPAIIDNNPGGIINNNVGNSQVSGAAIENGGTINNLGTINNNQDANLPAGSVVIANSGAINNEAGGAINNGDTITNIGDIANEGTITNYCGGLLTGTVLDNQPVQQLCETTTVPSTSPFTSVVTSSSLNVFATVSGEYQSIVGETISFSQTGGSGSVTFPSPPTCTITPPDSCRVTVTAGSIGPVVITASYGGDAGNAGSSGSTTIMVNPPLGIPTVTPSATSVDYGGSFSVSVSWYGGTDTSSGGYSVNLYSSSTGSCSPSSTPVGSLSGLTASPSTFSDLSPSSTLYYCATVSDFLGVTQLSAPVSVAVDADPTVSVSPSGPLTYFAAQSASALTASVIYVGPNTASVEWYSSSIPSCGASSTDTTTSGTSFTPSTASIGTTYYCAVVTDSGLPGYASASSSVEVTVTQATTTTTEDCSGLDGAGFGLLGAASACTATVTGDSPTVTGDSPTGTVMWTETGGSSFTLTSSTCTLSPSGSCSITLIAAQEGSALLTASYGGDPNNAPSSDAVSHHTISVGFEPFPYQGPTGTMATFVPGSSYPESYTYNYCYEPSTTVATPCVPTDQFTTDASGEYLGTLTVAATGSSNGLIVITDATTNIVESSFEFRITAPSITLSPASGPVGTTVTVTGSGFSIGTYGGSGGVPIGSFTYGGSTPATQTCTSQTTDSSGGFTCTFVVPASGVNTVTASGSDVGSIPADTASATFTAPGYAVVATPASVSFPAGSSGSSTISLDNEGGFSGAVSLTISAPSEITASLSATPIAGLATSTLSLSSATSGSYTVIVTGTSGSLTETAQLAVTVQKAPSVSSVACVPPSANGGSTVTCTVTVTGAAPSGTIAVSQTGGTGSFSPSPASCTLSSGTCTVTLTLVTPGGITLAAAYPGDSNNLGSSASTSLTVQAGAAVSLVCQQTALKTEGPTFCQAYVYTDDMGYAGGSVAWSVAPAGSGTFSQSQCDSFPFGNNFPFGPNSDPLVCSTFFTPSSSGAQTITAAYSGDSYHGTGSGAFTVFTGSSSSDATTVSLTCSPEYPNVTQTAQGFDDKSNCQATVTSADGKALTGSVAWSLSPSGGSLSNEQCNGQGPFDTGQLECSSQFTPASFGAETITATYSESGGHHAPSTDSYIVYAGAGQTDVTTAVLSQIPTSLTISCDQTKPNLNQIVNCVATINTADGGTPSGTVSWSAAPSGSGTFSNMGCPDNSGFFFGQYQNGQLQCSAQFKASTSGAITLTAAYYGDAYHASTTHTFGLFAGNTASSSATSLSLTCDQVSPNVGQNTNCQATVTSANGAALTGTVTWSVSPSEGSFSNEQCNSQPPYGSGELYCSSQFKPSAAGLLTITATYTESGGHHSSSSDTYVLFVGNLEASSSALLQAPTSPLTSVARPSRSINTP